MRTPGSTPIIRATRSAWRPAQLMRYRDSRPPPVVSSLMAPCRADMPTTRPPRHDLRSRGARLIRVDAGHLREVDDPRARRVQGGHAMGVGLDLPQPLGAYLLQAGDAVGHPSLVQLFHPTQLRLVGGDDHLAAPLVVDSVLVAKPDHGLHALDAELGLAGARTVVDSRVDDAAVVAGLVGGQLPLFLHHRHPAPGVPAGQAEGRRQADDPAAHDGDVVASGAHVTSRGSRQPGLAEARPTGPRLAGPRPTQPRLA